MFKIKIGYDGNGMFRVTFNVRPTPKRSKSITLKSGRILTYAN